MSDNIVVRFKTAADNPAVDALICDSLNVWYKKNRGVERACASPQAASIFTRIYDALDPGCCVVAEDLDSGKIAGSCFYHPRPTRTALGIMNVAPEYFGRKVSTRILAKIVEIAEERGLPLTLVSSAMNLDSFSLYNRAGFVPTEFFQDMMVKSPAGGVAVDAPAGVVIRDATLDDVPAIVALEREICGVEREKDYRFFIENEHKIWGASVAYDAAGKLCGVAVSVNDPGSAMIGPGCSRDEGVLAALIRAELNRYPGAWAPVVLIPRKALAVRRAMYALGAINTELHVAQALGETAPIDGFILPTFMPETF
ncbi:MAG: GNAT family N-acetyltransferase [Thermoguttaceae bacterium]|nr:GNAT family N-acetyltransferase [Thermoguttaceae bacterium]